MKTVLQKLSAQHLAADDRVRGKAMKLANAFRDANRDGTNHLVELIELLEKETKSQDYGGEWDEILSFLETGGGVMRELHKLEDRAYSFLRKEINNA